VKKDLAILWKGTYNKEYVSTLKRPMGGKKNRKYQPVSFAAARTDGPGRDSSCENQGRR
jgi:hypothetical protein